MKRSVCLLAVLAMVAPACAARGGDPSDRAADELAKIARLADTLEFRVDYRYQQHGPLAEAMESKLVIIQRPPESLRRIETTTVGGDDRTFTEAQWYVSKTDRDGGSDESGELRFYACYGGDFSTEGEVRCHEAPPPGVFGRQPIDQVFEFVRRPHEAFEEVARVAGARIAGEDATCFSAAHRSRTTAPTSSPAVVDPAAYRLGLCYSKDGVMLRLHREIAEPVPTGEDSPSSLMEATSITRTVRATDIRLPGDVYTAADALKSPSP